MPLGIALVVVVLAALAGHWTRRDRSEPVAPSSRKAPADPGFESAANPVISGWPLTESEPLTEGDTRLATKEQDQTSTSVLGWAVFRVVSVVVLDGTAIVACRGADAEAPQPRGPGPQPEPGTGPGATEPGATEPEPGATESEPGATGRRLGRISKPSSWPLLLASDQTLVLLIGDGEPAAQALELLERWRQADAVLCLRPTHVAGGIEFFDGHRSALRAMLLAD